jgi:hypothetical protein
MIETRGERVIFAPLPNSVPAPVTMTGAVINDFMTRTLVVRRPEQASGFEKLLWRESHRALELAVDRGWQTDHPTVWAGTKGDSILRPAHRARIFCRWRFISRPVILPMRSWLVSRGCMRW